jgi:hypothetical protein
LVEYAENKPKVEDVKQIIDHETVSFLKGYTLKAYDFVWLYTSLKNHEVTYKMAENKSNKQKNQAWAHELISKFEPLKLNADKFGNQLFLIFESKTSDYLQNVNTRHIAAKNYFYPVLKELSKSILTKIELLKDEKQIKTYIEELLELENLIFKQLQLLDKVTIVIDNVLNNIDFNKQQVKLSVNQNDRLDLVKNSMAISAKAKINERKTKTPAKQTKLNTSLNSKPVKSPKPDTKETSFSLYKTGKTIGEIAKERGLSMTTIESHMAHYVSLGMIPVTQFITQQKFDAIIKCSKKQENFNSTPIKLELGDEYTYADIRFALATQIHLKKDK